HDKFGDKFDCSKVVYKGIDEKITLICPEHGEFKVKIKTLLQNKYGCSKCGYINASKQVTSTNEEFITKANNIHNNKYDYSKVNYINNHTKVIIICPKHGEFEQTPHSHLQGAGCPKCCKTGVKLSTEEFIKKAKLVHDDKYDYSKVEYVNSQTKVCIICKEHGEFWQTPNSHLSGNKCFKCKGKLITEKKTFTKETFIEKAREVHGDRYDYSKVVYIKAKKPVCIICHKAFNNGEEHGEFWQTPDKHINSEHGCPKCSIINSKNEKDVFKYCSKLNQNIEENVRNIISPYELDIYLPDYKLAIEYNGLLWHSEKYGKDRNYHLNKLELCNQQGINLIQIFEDEYLEHKDIVLSKIKHILGKDTDLPKIQARKCIVREITKEESRNFLNKNHIQGACNASIHLGCFQDNHLVGVMTFKEERKGNNRWELNRFATDIT
ncbi:MAG: DUF723 domain-containing protein, partial [Bacilli bacterium]|nr:DUF723 domain-containing protein [Bacilli bacterium]